MDLGASSIGEPPGSDSHRFRSAFLLLLRIKDAELISVERLRRNSHFANGPVYIRRLERLLDPDADLALVAQADMDAFL